MPFALHRAIARAALLATASLVVGACLGPAASPTPVPAAGDTTTEARQLAPFTAVSVEGGLNLVLAAGKAQAVAVEAPTNILPLILTEVSGTELAVTVAAPGFSSTKPVTVRITSPMVTSVSLEGGCNGTMEAMGQALTLSVSGGSVLKAIGTVQQLNVTALGGADAQLGDLATDTAAISAAGGAKATLTVHKQLTGTADSGAVITLTVAPVAQSVTVSGGASIVGP